MLRNVQNWPVDTRWHLKRPKASVTSALSTRTGPIPFTSLPIHLLHLSTLPCLSSQQPQLWPAQRGHSFCKPQMSVKHVLQVCLTSPATPKLHKLRTRSPRLPTPLQLDRAICCLSVCHTTQQMYKIASSLVLHKPQMSWTGFLMPCSAQNTEQAHPWWRRCARN
jgi:hypothetical protein